NSALGAFGYQIGFALEPYQFGVDDENGRSPRTLKQLSESERFRFGVAFQIALAMATGLKFVIIDRADVLDAESRSALNAMLLDSGLDQAIVLATSDKPAPQSVPEGVTFVELRHGTAGAAE